MSDREEPQFWLSTLCADLSAEARAVHDVPRVLAEHAGRATASALSQLDRAPLSERECARVRAYFWSVVRRRALRMAAASRFTARVVRESIAEDLRLGGLPDDRVALELERCAV